MDEKATQIPVNEEYTNIPTCDTKSILNDQPLVRVFKAGDGITVTMLDDFYIRADQRRKEFKLFRYDD